MKRFLTIVFCVLCCVGFCIAQQTALQCKVLHSLSNVFDYKELSGISDIKLNLARGEYEHFQMVVTLPEGKKDIVVKRAGKELEFKCRKIEKVGDYDDVLVPAGSRISSESGVIKLWFTYHASLTAKPGNYDDKISVFCGDEKKVIPVAVNVNELVLPLKPSLPAVFGIRADMFTKILKIDDQDKKREAMEGWIKFLLDYRISPYLCDWLTRQEHEAYSSPWPMDDPRTVELFSDPRFTDIALPFYTLDDRKLDEMIKTAKYQGYYDKGYFYISDEPSNLKDYDDLDKNAARLHKFDSDANIITTFYCGPKEGERKDDLFAVYDLWDQHTKIFCMSSWALKIKEENVVKSKELLENDQEWWTYVCCGPGEKQPNYLLEQSPYNNRAVLWRVWKDGGTGFLYWAVNSFVVDANQPDKMAFRKGLPDGDGLLVYPGEFYGTKGPLASVRLERWLDGVEDYEYLRALEIFKGRDAAEKVLEQIYKGPVDYTADFTQVEKFKTEIYQLLQK
ncbi:MAG: DUF4091 domain-containing protein [Sedimentisphaeraceae bacterium JB056]